MAMKLIAEIKKSSPHDGMIAEHLNPVKLAEDYTRLGAHAISVVTSKQHDGDEQWIRDIRPITNLPIFQKDFLFHEDEIKRSRDNGVDWLLFVARMYGERELDELTFLAHKHGLKPVVEVHTPQDVDKAKKVDCGRIMINNRDIVSGKINLMTSFNLIPLISDQNVVITASGYDPTMNVLPALAKTGSYDYVLIGTRLLQSTDLDATFKELHVQLQTSRI